MRTITDSSFSLPKVSNEEQYNFISTTSTPRRKKKSGKSLLLPVKRAATKIISNNNNIIDAALDKWAKRLQTTNVSLKQKHERLRNALFQHSESNKELTKLPNAICISICFECLQQVLSLALPPHDPVIAVVQTGLLNAVYHQYDASIPLYENCPYSEIVRKLQSEKQFSEKMDLYEELIPQTKSSVSELVDVESQREALLNIVDGYADADLSLSIFKHLESTKRTEFVTQLPGTLTESERALLLEQLMLEVMETNGGEKVAEILENCDAESIVVSALTQRRRNSSIAVPTRPRMPSKVGSSRRRISTRRKASSKRLSLSNRQTSHQRLYSSSHLLLDKNRDSSVESTIAEEVRPDENGDDDDYFDEKLLQELDVVRLKLKLEKPKEALELITRMIYDKFELEDASSIFRGSETTKAAVEFTAGDENALMHEILSILKSKPTLLELIIKQAPEVLQHAIKLNNGILKYAMTKNKLVVKEFCQLDADAFRTFDHISRHHQGIQLMWGSDADINTKSKSESAREILKPMMDSHVEEIASFFVQEETLVTRIFEELRKYPEECKLITHNLVFQHKAFSDIHASAVASGLEAALKDPKVLYQFITKLYDTNHSSNVAELLHQNCPTLVLALNGMNPHAVREMLVNDIATWKAFLLRLMSENDFLLRDCIVELTNGKEFHKELLEVYDCVIKGDPLPMFLPGTEENIAPSSSETENSVSRKTKRQRLYSKTLTTLSVKRKLQGRKASAAAAALRIRNQKSNRLLNSLNLRINDLQELEYTANDLGSSALGTTSGSNCFLGDLYIPGIWKSFLPYNWERTSVTSHECKLIHGKRSLKAFVLEVFIDRLKNDLLDDNAADETGGDLTPYVCDYLMKRYGVRSVVGEYLEELLVLLERYRDDIRIGWFRICCHIDDASFADEVAHLLVSMGHLFFSTLRIYHPGKELQEIPDGTCALALNDAVSAARDIFKLTLKEPEMENLESALSQLKVVDRSVVYSPTHPRRRKQSLGNAAIFIDLDEAILVLMEEWKKVEAKVDNDYTFAFEACSGGNQFLGIDDFVKAVTVITDGEVAAREARIVFYDIGEDSIDLPTFLYATSKYDFRASSSGCAPVVLDELELKFLRDALDSSHLISFGYEYQSLVTSWEKIKPKIEAQLNSKHQREDIKVRLRQGVEKVEKSIFLLSNDENVPQNFVILAWKVFRDTVNALQSAMVTNQHLSMIFVQILLRRWIARVRARQAKAREAEEAENVILSTIFD